MLTYQVRERIFRLHTDQPLSFPSNAEVNFCFGPLQPFGESPGGGRTAVSGSKASVLFNANTGHHSIESKRPLAPLEVVVQEESRRVELRGRVLQIRENVRSLADLETLITSVAFAMPWLLSVQFADPPYLERVDGSVGDVGFRWELKEWYGSYLLTTQEAQEKSVAAAWLRFSTLSNPSRRRLLGALHYFHIACRLERASLTVGEFMPEVLLNLCKILESLFPGEPSRDAARAGLRSLGYDSATIERDFIPVMLLRNEVDVGHVQLAIFKRTDLTTLHSFVQSSERKFQLLLQKVLDEIEAGRWDVPEYTDLSPSADVLKLIQTIRDALAREATERSKEGSTDGTS